jgi:Zn-dependent protease with chaperone function
MLAAYFYDGRSAQRREVRLHIQAGRVRVEGGGVARDAALAHIQVSERLGSAPRLITFTDGAFCEVRDLAALERLLEQAGHRDGVVDRWQRSWAPALAGAFAVLAAGLAGYFYGLPRASAWLVERFPPAVAVALSQRTLETLDRQILQPSRLPAERIAALRLAFAGFAPGAVQDKLLFRSAPPIGANAFALPDGTIVLFDELVALADHDEQILAVLGHELGHVHHKHGLRLLVQNAATALVAAWWLGDFGGLTAAAASTLMQARYSRELEAEADAHAALLLNSRGIAPGRLAEMLEKLAAAHGLQGGRTPAWMDYLSSHPAPQERMRVLQDAQD